MDHAIGAAGGDWMKSLAQDFRSKEFSFRIEVFGKWPVARTWNASCDRINRLDFPTEALHAARVNRSPVRVAVHGGQHIVAFDTSRERCTTREHDLANNRYRGVRCETLRLPCLPAAVQHGHAFVTQPAQQPPQARCHRTAAAVMDHDLRAGIDAPLAQSFGQPVGIGQGMATGRCRNRARQVTFEMRVNGAWNMFLAPCRPAFFRLLQVETAIDDAPVRQGEMGVEGYGVNQGSKHGMQCH